MSVNKITSAPTNNTVIAKINEIIDNLDSGSVNIDNSTITTNSSDQIQTVGIKDARTDNTLKTWTGTRAQYEAIATKDSNTLYNITDDTDVTSSLLDLLYPVGAIYIGTMASCPLATLGIGTWEKVSEGRVLQGSDSNNSAGSTISAGLPNITGSFHVKGNNTASQVDTFSGAFYETSGTSGTNGYTGANNNTSTYVPQLTTIDASRSSSIYGNSTTVQPPAFVVNIWRRTA